MKCAKNFGDKNCIGPVCGVSLSSGITPGAAAFPVTPLLVSDRLFSYVRLALRTSETVLRICAGDIGPADLSAFLMARLRPGHCGTAMGNADRSQSQRLDRSRDF